jgi:hypothetical protein
MAGPMPGGVSEVAGAENDVQTVELARFALDEHNKKSVSFMQILSVSVHFCWGQWFMDLSQFSPNTVFLLTR